jgi:hypothetical protein
VVRELVVRQLVERQLLVRQLVERQLLVREQLVDGGLELAEPATAGLRWDRIHGMPD